MTLKYFESLYKVHIFITQVR